MVTLPQFCEQTLLQEHPVINGDYRYAVKASTCNILPPLSSTEAASQAQQAAIWVLIAAHLILPACSLISNGLPCSWWTVVFDDLAMPPESSSRGK